MRRISITHSTALFAIAFVLLWNSGFIGAEYGLPYAGPFTLLFWRYCALTLILLLYLVMRGQVKWDGWSKASPAFLVGILAHGVWLSCVLLALQYGVPAGIVALIIALQPMATGALSGVVVGEHTPLHRWLGLIIGFCGVAVPVAFRIDIGNSESVYGFLLPFGAVIAMTAANLIQRRMEVLNRSHRLSVDRALFYQSLATTLFLAAPAVYLEELATRWEFEFLGIMIWLVIGVSLGAYALMWLLLERMDATRLASLFYLGPPVTMSMAWAAFGDTLHRMDVAGLIIVSAGVLLTQLPKRSR